MMQGYLLSRPLPPDEAIVFVRDRHPQDTLWGAEVTGLGTLGVMRADADFERLVTERLILRRSLPEDAETISGYRSDPDVHRQQGWERTDPEGVQADIEEMRTRRPGEAGGWVQFSVLERAGGALVGDVGCSPADGEPGVLKLGYTIAPAAQGHGYATEAIAALVDYAFGTLGADLVRAYASADNLASIRVAEKVGLQLIERFEHREDGEVWFGVRYERRRDDAQVT
jgi:aminoglycoside 6'-N-acetyltransferase